MSEYWSATSGTVLVFHKEEAKDFFTRYLLETYRKDGVTDEDIDFINSTISDYEDDFYFLRSAYRQSLLEDFHSMESCVDERTATEHQKELFNCVEYCEEECSGGVLYPFKKPARGKFVDVEDGSCIIYTDFVDVEDGSYIIYTDKSTRPQDLLGADGYNSIEEIVKEFKEKLAAYVPDNFDWESHIGFFQCATFA